MRFETVDDIFAANLEARSAFLRTMADVSDDEAAAIVPGEKWSIGNIAEHLAMVDHGISRICRRLVSEARKVGNPGTGELAISPRFWELAESVAKVKVEAPEQVRPTGKISIREAIEMLQNNHSAFEELREDLKDLDLSGPKFPHPYFGEITAIEWMIVSGAHEARHTRQIERILTRIRQ